MGQADYYKPGEWNFYCDLCGKKRKSSDAMKTWDNFYVCKEHKEVRNPQDFVRGVKDDPSVPWSRSEVVQTAVVGYCTPFTRQGIVGVGQVGCMVVGLSTIVPGGGPITPSPGPSPSPGPGPGATTAVVGIGKVGLMIVGNM